MATARERPVWLEWCPTCDRAHRMTGRPCPRCGVYDVPTPMSDKVAEACNMHAECEGCEAYREHEAW